MSEGRPRLVAVPGVPEQAPGPERRPPARTPWWLVAAALICVAGWGYAQHRLGQVQRELGTTRNELSEARAKLAGLEAQRSEVHAQLKALSAEAGALAGRLAELEALASSDQPGATDAQALRSGSTGGE